MTKRRKILLWIGLIASVPAGGYAAMSVIYYAWLSAAAPDRWSPERAGAWVLGALLLMVFLLAVSIYCLVSLIKQANRDYRAEQNAA